MMGPSTLELVLGRDRLAVLMGLAGVTVLAWLYLFVLAADMPGDMDEMPGGVMTARIRSWNALDFLLMFLMWAVMMVGMMLPSATPMILLFALYARKQRAQGRAAVPAAVFVSGYLIVWTLFSAAATLMQWGLEQATLLSPMMVSATPYLAGGLLVAAGIYQLTPLKTACLKHCRSPFGFIALHWESGNLGGVRMGIRHGAFCVGCCWALMALLFVGGVMNLLWVAALAAFVLLEKVVPAGHWLGRAGGVAIAAWGVWLLAAALA